ncbi:hypothetical protein F2Q70_00033510 [Brassica cretica]|uniref:Uncharacterized protein n=1 Tax=Brassica cretica TaxID=69181 RepID=A0A8S9FLX3_BRACR|nr:hypothetical protein F2Q70_00033510 [Brassica cretica]
MIINHALSGIAVSMVMKYADNIVKISGNASHRGCLCIPIQFSSFTSFLPWFNGRLCFSIFAFSWEATMIGKEGSLILELPKEKSCHYSSTERKVLFLLILHVDHSADLLSTEEFYLSISLRYVALYNVAIIKKRPSRNINVQNFWLYVFGMAFNAVAIVIQDFDAVANKGFFHGYSFITVLMILNHALSGIAVSMVMKYADNIVKVYSTSVAMLLTAVVSVFLFNFHLSLAFFLGSTVVSVSVYLHSAGKLR